MLDVYWFDGVSEYEDGEVGDGTALSGEDI